MKIVAGIDIGNATTETALAKIVDGQAEFIGGATVPTTCLLYTSDAADE